MRAQEFVTLDPRHTSCESVDYFEVESMEECAAAAEVLGKGSHAIACPAGGCKVCEPAAPEACTLLPRGCLTFVNGQQITEYHYNGQGAIGGVCGFGQWGCVCRMPDMADEIKTRSPGCTFLDLDLWSKIGLDRGVCSHNSYGDVCTAYVHSDSERFLTCSQWCGQHGRAALSSGWTCGAAFESEADGNYIYPNGYPCSNTRRLTTGIPGHLDNVLMYPWEANIKECCPKQPLGCDEFSPVGRLLCECNTGGNENVVLEDEGRQILLQFLSDFNNAPKHGNKLEVEWEGHQLGAYMLSYAGIVAVGGTITIEIDGTSAGVRVPASVLSRFNGGVGILVVAVHSRGRDESSNLLDDQDEVVPLLGAPVNVRFATVLGEFVQLRDLEDPIGVRLPTNVPQISWSCAWWEASSKRWTTQDIEFESEGDNYIWCETRHLTLFAALGQALFEALLCSNAVLMSDEGVRMIVKGSWFYEPGAIFLWLVCLLHVGLCTTAVRFDMRSRREALWNDRYFLSLEDGKKSRKTEAQVDSKGKQTLRNWVRVELIVFCVQELVSHALWISSRDMPALIDCAENEEEGDENGDAEAREEPGSVPGNRRPARSEGDFTPAAVAATEIGRSHAEAVERAVTTEISEGLGSKPILSTRSFFGTGFRPDRFRSKSLPGVDRSSTAVASPTEEEPPPPKDDVRPEPEEEEEPPAKDDPPSKKNTSAHFRLLMRNVFSSRPLDDAGRGQPEAARCFAKPIKRELEKNHQHVTGTMYPRCYISWIIFYGAIPWPHVYRFSIFESATTRALHLSAEIFGAMLFSAFFFGIDAPAVDTPESCEAEDWWGQLWDELAAGFLSFWFALIPVLILRLLSMRTFKVVWSQEEIDRQLMQWRIRDAVMWTLGVSYIAFAIFFIITFLASTKPGSGASFAVSSVFEELWLYLVVPLCTVLAYCVLDILFDKEEKDFEQAREKLRLERKKLQDIRRRSTMSV